MCDVKFQRQPAELQEKLGAWCMLKPARTWILHGSSCFAAVRLESWSRGNFGLCDKHLSLLIVQSRSQDEEIR